MRIKRKFLWVVLLFILVNVGTMSVGNAGFFDSLEKQLELQIGYYNYLACTEESQPAQLSQSEIQRINTIFNNLTAKASRNKEIEYSLTIVNDPNVNAFALPGGYVFLNNGLISYAKSDGEIAGVLAHEIAHIEKKHGMKALYRSVGMTALISLALKDKDDSTKTKALATVAAISMSLIQNGFSREAEFDADTYGVKLMSKAGYNKREILNFWDRMIQNKESNDSKFLKLFSTHPPTEDRIKNIESIETV